jgi:hypothetical protein
LSYKTGAAYSEVVRDDGSTEIRVWDNVDMVYPTFETNAITVATVVEETI